MKSRQLVPSIFQLFTVVTFSHALDVMTENVYFDVFRHKKLHDDWAEFTCLSKRRPQYKNPPRAKSFVQFLSIKHTNYKLFMRQGTAQTSTLLYRSSSIIYMLRIHFRYHPGYTSYPWLRSGPLATAVNHDQVAGVYYTSGALLIVPPWPMDSTNRM